ncbi:MAG: energy transducer TonB [Acidobacteriota bacterium]
MTAGASNGERSGRVARPRPLLGRVVRLGSVVAAALTAGSWGSVVLGDAAAAVEGLAPVEQALRLHDLRAGDAGPVTLIARGTFHHLVGGDRGLHFALMVYGPGRWFHRLTAGGHVELRGRTNGSHWRRRPASKKSYSLVEADMLLDPASHLRLAPGARVRKSWSTDVGGASAQCLQVGPPDTFWLHDVSDTAKLPEVGHDLERTVDLCFDRNSGALVLADYGGNFPRYEYAGAVELAGKRFPRSLRCFEQKRLMIEAEVVGLSAAEVPEGGAASLPEGVESWPACVRPAPPKVVAKKSVLQPAYAKARRAFGQVICRAEVSTGGNLHDFAFVDDRGHAILRAAVDVAVPEWTFEPATCDGTPVPCEVYLAIQFTAR